MPSLRYLLDEHISPNVATELRKRGVDILSASDAGLLHDEDAQYLARGIADNRVVVTGDKGFLRENAKGTPHAGIVFCSDDAQGIGTLVQELLRLATTKDTEQMNGQVEFL